MCLVSAPKASTTAAPPPQYLHNTFLDSGTMAGAMGRNNLVVGLNAQGKAGLNLPVTSAPPAMASAGLTPKTGIMNIQTPGMVVPTIGGSLAGSVPGAVVPGTSGAPGFMRGPVQR